MPKKHIIIISTMLITAFGIFVTSWILSHRTSDVDSNEGSISNVTKTLDVQGRISTPRKREEVVLKEETQTDDDIQGISDAVDYNQDEGFMDGLTESQNEDASQVEENAAMYAALREPLKRLHSLYIQWDSSEDELAEMIRTGRGFGIVNGRIEMDEFFGKLDEKTAIYRQILETAKEAQRIAPNAIEVIKKYIGNPGPFPGPNRIYYDIKISRPKLESSWGKIPADLEASFPGEHTSVVIPEDENFSWVEWYRENERERLAR